MLLLNFKLSVISVIKIDISLIYSTLNLYLITLDLVSITHSHDFMTHRIFLLTLNPLFTG
jgi:hypothetical protein